MKLSEVGERWLIELARSICKRAPHVRVGIGDDAAAIDLDRKRCLVVTTDLLAARTHFPPGTTARQMGLKAVVANLSDLAAMGAKPFALVFSTGLPRGLETGFVEDLIKSMDSVARRYGTFVVGGDLGEADEVIIAGAAFGLAEKRGIMTRSGAKSGDLIAVTGELGAAAAGLEILLKNIPPSGFKRLVKAQLEPRARVGEGLRLAQSGQVTSAIDLTDGLAANLWHLARESKVKLIVDRAEIPVHPLVEKFAAHRGRDVDDFVLYGGEDFELLFTVRPQGWERVRRALKRVGTRVTQIGRVAEGRGVFIQRNGKTLPLPDRGYEHFKTKRGSLPATLIT